MKNYLLLALALVTIASCEKEGTIEPTKKQTSTISSDKEPLPSFETIVNMDDKILYINPKFEFTGLEAYGLNCYNFESGLELVAGKWVTVHFCSGDGTNCGFVYAGDGTSREVIGVYKSIE